ncbi:MAG: ABC-F family ATP-binding cassette domain-containing protein [Clostridia bacterium]|nr:ABC-F family ATP-binding cassette domain-containing protein [Clostridia bacterium]
MIALSLSDVTVAFGTDVILDKVSFSINEGTRLGVVGVNGAGKSLLLKTICGINRAEDGNIFFGKDKRVSYLEQNAGFESEKILFDEMLGAFDKLCEWEERLSFLQKKMNDNCPEDEHMMYVKEYTMLEESFRKNGGYEYKSRIKSMLTSLGFPPEKQMLPISALSGGQKTRVALARTLLGEPDILMLDEPTNHLDIESCKWLEGYLASYKKTLIVISHDRYFLDKVTTHTLEVENQDVKLYNCSYTGFVKRKEEDRKNDEKHYLNQKKEIERLEAFIENQRRWNRERNIIAAESRMKAIDRMEKIDKPKNLPDRVSFNFSSGKSLLMSERMLDVKGLSKAFPGKVLFENLSFLLHGQDRMFFVGPNGVGKSTLLKILSGRMAPDKGSFEYVKGIKIGYYDQEHQGLNPNNTVLDELWNNYPDKKQGEIRGVLARFLFKAEDVFKKVEVLSGGEKARLTFAKLMLEDLNLLILDEPTNHLDASSREVLEDAILNYDGTVMAVSHDRYFLSKLATRILDMRPDGHTDYKGTYEDYEDYKRRMGLGESVDTADTGASVQSGSKEDYLKNKEEKSRRRKFEKKLADSEKRISEIEKRQQEIEKEMQEFATDYLKTAALYEESTKLNEELEKVYEAWEEANTELGN